MKKGLRQIARVACSSRNPLNYCPDEEGIKTLSLVPCRARLLPLNYCPDEEGIKTLSLVPCRARLLPLNYCPDEEGIKTLYDTRISLIAHFFELLP